VSKLSQFIFEAVQGLSSYMDTRWTLWIRHCTAKL